MLAAQDGWHARSNPPGRGCIRPVRRVSWCRNRDAPRPSGPPPTRGRAQGAEAQHAAEPLPRGRTWMATKQAAVPEAAPPALSPRERRHRRSSPGDWTPARSRMRRWTLTPTVRPPCDHDAGFIRRPDGQTQAISNVQPALQVSPAQDRARVTRTILPLVSQTALAPGERAPPGGCRVMRGSPQWSAAGVPPPSGRPVVVSSRLQEAGHRRRRPQESDR
jgi:hypothetical protein